LILIVVASWMGTTIQAASPTGWSPIVVPRGGYRNYIQSLPIEQRPGRPLHVYGNTVRLIDQGGRVEQRRPLRQILFGTNEPRREWNRAERR
jgi:hypothetical protein